MESAKLASAANHWGAVCMTVQQLNEAAREREVKS
jgi:hypothetical protein